MKKLDSRVPAKEGTPPVFTLVGAGSRIFGFSMCTDLCQTPQLKGATVRLVDIDSDRLDKMARLFKVVSQRTGHELRITRHTRLEDAARGSDFVVIAVAHERIERWDADLAISRKYGFIEAQGECGGPGGLSLTLRNVPLMIELARVIEREAPRAVVLNYTNPMTRVCRALSRYTRLNVAGLCHGLLNGQSFLSQLMKREVRVSGFGINHFNWIHAIRWADTGEDAWREATNAFRASDLNEGRYTRELFEVFGRIVTPGDGHIADFIHHWRGSDGGLMPRYRLHPKNMEVYRKDAAQWDLRLDEYLSGRRNPMDDVKGLSGEGAIPVSLGFQGMIPPYDEIAVNLPNRGYIANLPDGVMVEVPARISHGGIEGCAVGGLPLPLRSLVARQLDIAELAVEAAVEGSREKALQALAIDPLITDLAMARDYLRDILEAHRDLLPQFHS